MAESILLSEWGPLIGLTLLIAVSFIRGWVVSGKELKYWRDAFFEQQRQTNKLMYGTEVTLDVLKAVPKAMPKDSP